VTNIEYAYLKHSFKYTFNESMLILYFCFKRNIWL